MTNLFDLLLRMTRTVFNLREGEILGKLDLQKTFYFAKELGVSIPFTFRWGKLGPYSYELSNVIERLTSHQFIKYINGRYERGVRHEDVDPLELPQRVQEGARKFFDDLNDIRDEKPYIDPIYFIECLASIHFLYKYSGLRKKEEVFERLRQLKKERMDFLEPLMEDSWKFLKKHDLIT